MIFWLEQPIHNKLKIVYFIVFKYQENPNFLFVDSVLKFKGLNKAMTPFFLFLLLYLHFSCWKLYRVPLGREKILNSTSCHGVSEKKNRFLKIYHEINTFPQVTSLITQPSSQNNSNWNAVWPLCLQKSASAQQCIDHFIEVSRSGELCIDLKGEHCKSSQKAAISVLRSNQ